MSEEYPSRQGTHQTWTYGNLDILQLPNNRLVLITLYACQRPNDCEYVIVFLVLSYGLLSGVMVLLVREEDVVEEGAFTWEKGAGYLEGFCMPEL